MPNIVQRNVNGANFRLAMLFLFTEFVLASGRASRNRHHLHHSETNATHTASHHPHHSDQPFNWPLFLVLYSSVIAGACLCACAVSRLMHAEEEREAQQRNRNPGARNNAPQHANRLPQEEERTEQYKVEECSKIPAKKPISIEEIKKIENEVSNPKDKESLQRYCSLLKKFDPAELPVCSVMHGDLSKGVMVHKTTTNETGFFESLEIFNESMEKAGHFLPLTRAPISPSDAVVYKFEFRAIDAKGKEIKNSGEVQKMK